MEARATAKYIHMSSRKTRLVIDLVRGLKIEEARRQLMFSRKLAAKPILKVLNSAVANAENNLGVKTDDFTVVTAFVDEGPTIHRFRPRAQGRAAAIRKRMSHITIVVGDGKGVEIAKKKDEKDSNKKISEKQSTKKETVAKKEASKKKSKLND